jgi:hypothetical protein
MTMLSVSTDACAAKGAARAAATAIAVKVFSFIALSMKS